MYGRNSLFASDAQLTKAVLRAGLGQRALATFSAEGKIGECLRGIALADCLGGDAVGEGLPRLSQGEDATGLLGIRETLGVPSPRRCGVPRPLDGLQMLPSPDGFLGGKRRSALPSWFRGPGLWPRDGGSEQGKSAACSTASAPPVAAPPSLAGRVIGGGRKLAINSSRLSSRSPALPFGSTASLPSQVIASDDSLWRGARLANCRLGLPPGRPVGEASSVGPATRRPVAPSAPTPAGLRLRAGGPFGVSVAKPL